MTTPTVEVHLGADELAAALREDARRGLTSSPKELPPKWFYDERGSELFEAITELPEYYPTRRERTILAARAPDVARVSGADTLVELGSGTSEKTRLLLAAFEATGQLVRFVPFDVSEATLRSASRAIAADHPTVAVHAVVGDFERHLPLLPRDGRRLVAFLGGTVGNLAPAERQKFLAELSAGLAAGESLLLGADLVKDQGRLIAAYDDRAGVTADFNRNVLRVLDRELGADFVPERFAHVAVWDDREEWIEMRLRSIGDQIVHVRALDLTVEFADGEEMRTEISAKFQPAGIAVELDAVGLEVAEQWTDPDGDFAVTLAVKP